MKFFRKTAISLMVAASLTACSNDKNESKEASDSQAVTAVSQAKTSKTFEEMISHIPANTSYLIANSKTLPKDVIEFQMQRMQAFSSTLASTFEASAKRKAADGSEGDTEGDLEGFLHALGAEFYGNLSADGMKKLGLKLNGHMVMYGLDMMPVMRYEISNKEDVKALLDRASKKSGYKLEWSKCGEYECMTSEKDEMGVMAMFVDNQIALSLFPVDKKQQFMDHLTGASKPESSYKAADWSAFLSENKFVGYSDGFVKLDAMVDKVEQFALEAAKKDAGENFDAQALKGCFAVAKAHTANVPEMVFGTKKFSKNVAEFEIIAKTSPMVTKVLQSLPNKLTGMQQPENPVMSFGINFNMPNLRGAITQYINFLAEEGEANKCEAINPADLRKAVGGISMAMSMGASQFKSVYVALDNVELDADGKPSKIEAFGTVMASDPMGLLQMLAMVNPQFATLQLPEDGTPVKLPEGVIPPGPISPEVALGRKGEALNIYVGGDKLALKPMTLDDSTFMWGVTDSKRYYGLLNNVMKNLPQKKADTADTMEILNAVGDISGVISQKIGADSRGLVIDYTVNYK